MDSFEYLVDILLTLESSCRFFSGEQFFNSFLWTHLQLKSLGFRFGKRVGVFLFFVVVDHNLISACMVSYICTIITFFGLFF